MQKPVLASAAGGKRRRNGEKPIKEYRCTVLNFMAKDKKSAWGTIARLKYQLKFKFDLILRYVTSIILLYTECYGVANETFKNTKKVI